MKGLNDMKSKSAMGSIVKGLAAGAVVGTATYMMTSHKKSSGTKMKKNASKAMKAVGTVIENVSYLMK